MSKSITIPKDRDPFVVIVNGVEYKYTAGETVTVPDPVADVIEKYENAKPKPDPNAGAGSNECDWNKMVNKPFGETLDTLTWDGNTDGLENFQNMFFKVSDAVPTLDDFANGFNVVTSFGESLEFTIDNMMINPDTGVLACPDGFFTVSTERYAQLMGISTGVYFLYQMGMYPASLTINGYTGFSSIKRLDEKYMPILTSPSGKKFKLSVDDSGAVTATEA